MYAEFNHANDTIESLHKNIRAIGSDALKQRADALLVEQGITEERRRINMLALLATAEWNYEFTAEAKAKKMGQFRENFDR